MEHPDQSIMITGSQGGLKTLQQARLYALLAEFRPEYHWLRHGDCIGVDETAAYMWTDLGGELWCHPPLDPRKRAFVPSSIVEDERDYLVRNHRMVDAVEHVIGAPGSMTEVSRSGTWATLRYARRLGRNYMLVMPNGEIRNSF